MKPEHTISNFRYGWLTGTTVDLYRVWNKRLGAAVFFLIALGVVYNIGLLEWREFYPSRVVEPQ